MRRGVAGSCWHISSNVKAWPMPLTASSPATPQVSSTLKKSSEGIAFYSKIAPSSASFYSRLTALFFFFISMVWGTSAPLLYLTSLSSCYWITASPCTHPHSCRCSLTLLSVWVWWHCWIQSPAQSSERTSMWPILIPLAREIGSNTWQKTQDSNQSFSEL